MLESTPLLCSSKLGQSETVNLMLRFVLFQFVSMLGKGCAGFTSELWKQDAAAK